MKVVIIGGVAAGPKSAARLRRLNPNAEITIVEQGDLISYGSCGLPLYVGNLIPDIMDLMKTSSGSVRDPDFFFLSKNVKVLIHTRAEMIDRTQKCVTIHNLKTDERRVLPYDYLVLATGAMPVVPNFPGCDLPHVFTLYHPKEAQTLRDLVRSKKIKHLTIIGAGLIGMETADALVGSRVKIALCEAQPQILPKLLDADMAAEVEQEMRQKGLELYLSSPVKRLIAGADGSVAQVETANELISTDAVLLAIGTCPTVELAGSAGLELGVTGAIKVNNCLQTSDPAIYAGGDCVENNDILTGQRVYAPLASTANKHGRVIADQIAGRNSVFPGVAKTSVLQCFDLNIGRTGLGEEEARQKGYDFEQIIISGYDAAHYYPMHDKVKVKLLAQRSSGKILGAQVVGAGDVIKRLDVLVAAMKYGGTLEDIGQMDLGYAPPFSTAIDLVAHAANALHNKISGLISSISGKELSQLLTDNPEQVCILDIRTKDEVISKPIRNPNKIEIPLDELHNRWQELPSNKKIITICELGIRSFEAACMLQGKGLNGVTYLEGGLSFLAN